MAGNAFLVLMIILADIKLYCRNKTNRNQLPYCHKSYRRRNISPISFRQTYFQVKVYLCDIIDDLKSFQVIKLIFDFATLIFLLASFLFGSVGVLRCMIFMTERLSNRFRSAFLPDQPSCRYCNTILSVLFTFLSFTYMSLIVYHLGFTIQIIFRAILTTSAFIFTFASHFNFIIIMAIPFMLYVIQIIDIYIRNDQVIPNRIVELQQKLDQDIVQILEADQGNLDVYIAINYDGTITIDLPEMLQDDGIRSCINYYIQCLGHKPNHQMTDGISTLTIKYQRLPNNAVEVQLFRCIIGCNHCPYLQDAQPVLDCIKQHLHDKNFDYFKDKLSEIYYPMHSSPNGTHKSMAIPDELYQYLRYHSPRISLSKGRILFNMIVIGGFFSIFILTAMIDFRSKTFLSLNSAIANTPALYVTAVLSFRNLKVAKLKEKEIDKILLINLIHYRRGYRLFCRRGIHFQPFTQLIRMTMLYNRYPQHMDQVEHHSDDDDTQDCLYHSDRTQSKSLWVDLNRQIGFNDAGNYVAINNDDGSYP